MKSSCFFFFFNDTATTEIYTLSLHDALPISPDGYMLDYTYVQLPGHKDQQDDLIFDYQSNVKLYPAMQAYLRKYQRSEEHTSELQSRQYLVCRLLLEKKKHHDCRITRDARRH